DAVEMPAVPDLLDEIEDYLALRPVVVLSGTAVALRQDISRSRIGPGTLVSRESESQRGLVRVDALLQRTSEAVAHDPLLHHPTPPIKAVGDGAAPEEREGGGVDARGVAVDGQHQV